MKRTIVLFFGILFFAYSQAENPKIIQYKLDNGLTVILNEDHTLPTVFGCVAVRAGAKDDPDDATGLAHYMEHVMFKGTQDMGTSDWDSEKPHYEKIIQLYEEKRNTDDPEKKKELSKQIDEESFIAGKYAIPNEFSNLVQAMGGTGLNAATGYDFTYYHNSFPPFQIKRWLDLYAHRFVNPVYRGFQTELETVYEEKNMYSDNPWQAVSEDFSSKMYGDDNPYGRLIVGKTKDLKNPSIKRIKEFYDAFYVPSNMVLILSGDIDSEAVKPMIEATFGTWAKTEQTGVAKKPSNIQISGTVKVKEKLTPYPIVYIGYPAVPLNDDDEYPIEFCSMLLSNQNKTGLLDRLEIDGDLMNVFVGVDQRKYAGMLQIGAIPAFDMSQMKFIPFSSVEKMLDKEIEKIKKGEFEDWQIDAFKDELIREYDKLFESPRRMGLILMNTYVYEVGLDKFLHYKEKIQSITKEDIVNVAKKYFTDDRLIYLSDIGEPDKDGLEKPHFKPIEPTPGQKSKYAEIFENIPLTEVKEKFVDFNSDIQETQLADNVKLYYTPNPKNEIFSLTIKFGAGTGKIKDLDLATRLMGYAGIMAQYKPQELKKEYSKLGCSVNFSCNESYLYITLEGREENLGKACQLLSRTFLLPALEEKQMNNVIGSEISYRRVEKKNKENQAAAMKNYILYDEDSPELTRTPSADLQALTISNLTGKFIEATHYETSVHFCGTLPFNQLKETLRNNLALPSNMKKSESPYVRSIVKDNQEVVYFFNNPDARQSEIYLFSSGNEYSLDEEPTIDAFNEYFSGGFNGLVIQELREKRSFAYYAGANYVIPPLQGKKTYLLGYIGTQSDKTADAVSEFMKLIKEMPEKPERIDNIKEYLIQSSQSNRPGFRLLSRYIEMWKQEGYTDDPNKVLIPSYKQLTFDDIKDFYQKEIATKPVSIAIVGNKKEIDMDKLKSVAKIVTVNNSKIFKD